MKENWKTAEMVVQMSIKDQLKKNETIRYLGVCVKNINDAVFRKKLLTLYDRPDSVLFNHLGEENPNSNIYMMYTNNPTRGFFSLFNLTLDGLYFADYYNMRPVVEWGEATLYHEDGGVDGVFNSFEYYFKQPCGISVSSARHSKNVVFYEYSHRKLSIPDFNLTIGASLTDDLKLNSYLNKRAEIIRKYITFSDNVKQYLYESADGMFTGKKTLGVHVRGTDMNVGYNGHAKIVTPEEYLKAAKKAFDVGEFENIFLATDEGRSIELFQKEFGRRLLFFTDILRSDDGQALHFSKSERRNHKYLLGLEVLRDMYVLSLCDGLVAGVSNVSLTARMMKRSYGKEYEQINILSHGFNQTNISMAKK